MKVTLEEIAKMAGVSKATVSRVVNNSRTGVSDETRCRIKEILKKLNYSTDLSYRGSRTNSIALIIPDISNPFFAELALAVERSAQANGYIVILANTDFDEILEREYILNLIAKKVDGIILVSSGFVASKEHFAPQKYGIPLLLLDRRLEGMESYPAVYSDSFYASYHCCEHMIQHGAKKIVYISGSKKASTSADRLNGYKSALEQYSIDFDSNMVINGDYSYESGYDAIVKLEKLGAQYSGVVAANDMMAFGAIKALQEYCYKIPDDVSITGFDNILFSKLFTPSLSTVQQPITEMGQNAVNMIIKLIKGEKIKQIVCLQPKLVLRQTTKV